MMNFTRFSFISLAVIGSIFLAACNESQESKTSTDNAAPTAKAPNTKIKAKVRKVLGETDLKRKDSDQWSRLRYGQTVAEYDRIRTAVESEAVMSVNDGTSLWIAELSDVTLDVEIFDSLRHEVAVNVNKGGVFFDVQKQDGRTIKFNTGVATAAIRGTAGFIYSRDGQMVASLKEGLVDVSSNKGATGNVAENQTLIVGQDGVIKNLKLKSSGTKALSVVLSNVDIYGEGPKADSLEKALQTFDNDYATRMAAFEKKLNFRASPLPDTLLFSSVTLQARVNPGVIVTVLGESDTVPESGIYQRTIEWDGDTYGQKRFLATCSDGDVEVKCFTWTAVYVNPQPPESSASTEAETPVEESSAGNAEAAVPSKKENREVKPKKQEQKQKADAAAETKQTAKAEENKPKAEEKKVEEPKPKAEPAGVDLNVSVKLSGGKSEKKHLDLPASEYNTNLKFSLAGITADDLSQVSSITVKHAGDVVSSFSGASLSGLSYEVPVQVGLNTRAKYEIEVLLKSGKKVRATKTYEVYCLRDNHMGKARNCVKYDRAEGGGCKETHEEEYEAVKDRIKDE